MEGLKIALFLRNMKCMDILDSLSSIVRVCNMSFWTLTRQCWQCLVTISHCWILNLGKLLLWSFLTHPSRQRIFSSNSNKIIKTVALQDPACTRCMSASSITLCNLYCEPFHVGGFDLELNFLWCFIWLGMWTHEIADTGANKSTFYSQSYTSWWNNGCLCSYKFCVYTDCVMCALCSQHNAGGWE